VKIGIRKKKTAFRDIFVKRFIWWAPTTFDYCKLIHHSKFHKLESTVKNETQMTCNLIYVNWYNFNSLQVVIQMLFVMGASDAVYNPHSYTQANITQ
jgi:hypothetical protein